MASPPFGLLRPVGFVEGHVHPPPNQPREDVEKGLAYTAGEGEVRRERRAAGDAFEMIVEDAADAAMDTAMGDEEILVRPLREAGVVGLVVTGAGGGQAGQEVGRISL